MNEHEENPMSDDDELTGIFDDLTPEDFEGVTVVHTPGDQVGHDSFNVFVEANILAVRHAYLASDGMINPIATLATSTMQWTFAPDDNETMGEYMARLKSEAQRLGASWFFISRKTLVGSAGSADKNIDVNDPVALQEGIEKGTVSEGVFFYAARHEGDERECRHGIMKAHGNRLGELLEGNPEQSNQFFSTILD